MPSPPKKRIVKCLLDNDIHLSFNLRLDMTNCKIFINYFRLRFSSFDVQQSVLGETLPFLCNV